MQSCVCIVPTSVNAKDFPSIIIFKMTAYIKCNYSLVRDTVISQVSTMQIPIPHKSQFFTTFYSSHLYQSTPIWIMIIISKSHLDCLADVSLLQQVAYSTVDP